MTENRNSVFIPIEQSLFLQATPNQFSPLDYDMRVILSTTFVMCVSETFCCFLQLAFFSIMVKDGYDDELCADDRGRVKLFPIMNGLELSMDELTSLTNTLTALKQILKKRAGTPFEMLERACQIAGLPFDCPPALKIDGSWWASHPLSPAMKVHESWGATHLLYSDGLLLKVKMNTKKGYICRVEVSDQLHR